MRHNMSSKKSSQAQPGRLPPTDAVENDLRCHSGDRHPPAGAADFAPHFRCPPWPPASDAIAEEVAELIKRGDWGRYQPEILSLLREKISESLNIRHVRLVCSGSAAIELTLHAIGLGAPSTTGLRPSLGNDHQQPSEVICSVLDYPGNARAVRLLGGVPVMVDTCESGWTIDPAAVAAAATSQTVAVIASHLYGEIAAVDSLRPLCDANGWVLIEDVCQMPGGLKDGRWLGTFGHVATWSFGGSKPLTAGCGGAITTDDDRIAQRLAAYIDRPSDAFSLSPLQAAALVPQWNALESLRRSQQLALSELIQAIGDSTPGWTYPGPVSPLQESVFYKIPITIVGEFLKTGAEPARIIDRAAQSGIPAGEPFRIPARLAPTRGRIASSQHATAIAARSWLMDHRVLAATAHELQQLAGVITHLFKELHR